MEIINSWRRILISRQKNSLILFLAAIVCSSIIAKPSFAGKSDLISIDCRLSTLGSCLHDIEGKSGIIVEAPDFLLNNKVDIGLKYISTENAIVAILNSANLENVVISWNNVAGNVKIDVVGARNPSIQITESSSKENKNTSATSLEEVLRQPPTTPAGVNQDEIFEWPDGSKYTVREMQLLQERAEANATDPNEIFFKDASGEVVVRRKDIDRMLQEEKSNNMPEEALFEDLRIDKKMRKQVLDFVNKKQDPIDIETLTKP